MAGVTAQGGTFTFNGMRAFATAVRVEAPVAEVVDMTAHNAPVGRTVLVPTGHKYGGSVTVEYIHAEGGLDPQVVVNTFGPLSFASPGFTVQRQAVLESAETEATVGDLVRGTLKFRITDHYSG